MRFTSNCGLCDESRDIVKPLEIGHYRRYQLYSLVLGEMLHLLPNQFPPFVIPMVGRN